MAIRRAPKEIVGRPPWKVRRMIVKLTLIFCAVSVAYLMVFGAETELNRTIANGCFLLSPGGMWLR
jgi:hypothetical protein